MTVKTFKQAVHSNDQSLQPLSQCIYVPSLSVSMETVKQLVIAESAEFKLTLSGHPKGGSWRVPIRAGVISTRAPASCDGSPSATGAASAACCCIVVTTIPVGCTFPISFAAISPTFPSRRLIGRTATIRISTTFRASRGTPPICTSTASASTMTWWCGPRRAAPYVAEPSCATSRETAVARYRRQLARAQEQAQSEIAELLFSRRAREGARGSG